MSLLLMMHSGGGIFEEIFKWAIRGFAWHAGSRIAGALPLWIIIVILVIAAIVWFVRRRR